LALLGTIAGCRGPSGPPPDTALVTVDDRDLTVELESCGRDGDTVFVLGEGDGAVLQLVLEVEGDGGDGEAPIVRDGGAGFSLLFDDGDAIGAFGELTAIGAGVPGGATGSIDSTRIDGSRLRVSGDTEVLDAANRGTGEAGGRVTIDANCPDRSELDA
jgi:hypothetical protein